MNAQRLLAHFDRISEAPDAIPRLRRFVLDLAVRGKLGEQDPKDGSAQALLLLNDGIRQETAKVDPRADPDVQPMLAAEYRWDVPPSWQWRALADLVLFIDYRGQTPSKVEMGVRLITAKNVRKRTINPMPEEFLSEADYQRWMTRGFPKEGDILFTTEAPLGNAAVVRLAERFALAQRVICFRNYGAFNPDFLVLQLVAEPFQAILDKTATGLTAKGIKAAKLKRLPIVIPPLAEQKRIVSKVDELMELCDQLEAAKGEREESRDRLVAASLHRLNQPADTAKANTPDAFRDHARFTLQHFPRLTTRLEHIKQLRKTILNLAVHGKLVPQDPNDEPAQELLKRIQKEKARLIKDGKAKKNEALPSVDKTDVPFRLPKDWTWARFPELGILGRGKSKHRPRNDPALFQDGTHLFVQTGDVARSRGVIETFTGKYNETGLAQSYKWPKGTLCITIAANIADSGILSFEACFPDSVVGFIPASTFPNARYFEYFIRTAKADLLEFAPATAQKNINLEILNAVLIPLPPLAEQRRIVAKVDELMGLCDQLETQLNTTEADSRSLLEAMLHEALAPALEESV